ncbi:MAG TPA: hypothetical protein VF656_06945 [Pyrinomonadaceae bacterium]|jgi:hypothetical protein
MRSKTLGLTISLALFFLACAQVGWTQQKKKEGEAQAVLFDEKNWPILKFSNQRADKQNCGLFVGYALTDKQEEAFRIKVSHMHARRFFQGVVSYPEDGWLYLTPSRIIFVIEKGDSTHGFDALRTSLKDKPVTKFDRIVAGMQLNFRESPSTSDTGDQKFAFLLFGEKKCQVKDSEPYTEFIVRAVKDFAGAMAEFKQVTAKLKQAGKIEPAPPSITPPGGLAPQVP